MADINKYLLRHKEHVVSEFDMNSHVESEKENH